MFIADNIIKNKLKNVYFLWGRGKTTIANSLKEKYGFYVYSTDESRDRQAKYANSIDQPYMCRDYMKEYGVKSFWELPQEVIKDREKHFLEEVTPMIIAELIELSSLHKVIICEGDLDYLAVSKIATHAVYLCNQSTNFDWFNRIDHEDIKVTLSSRIDLNQEEKQNIIDNAYGTTSDNEGIIPEWVTMLGIKYIIWNNQTSIHDTTTEVARCFGFDDMDE